MLLPKVLFLLLLAVVLVAAQSKLDGYGQPIADASLYLPMDQFWSSSSVGFLTSRLGNSWYATQMSTELKQLLKNKTIDVDENDILSLAPWSLNLIAPPVVTNVTVVQDIIRTHMTPATLCRPDYFRTIIGRLTAQQLEVLANVSLSDDAAVTSGRNWTRGCLKQFAMTYLLQRPARDLSRQDIDLLLPAGLYLAPTYMLRSMSLDSLNYMMTKICAAGSSFPNPAESMSALQLRALLEQMVMNNELAGTTSTMPNAMELCRCLAYLRRPIIERYNQHSFGYVHTMTCYLNESALMDFSGEFTEPELLKPQRDYMSTVYYERDQCRYGRSPMVDWTALSKVYHKVNSSYYNVINCFSLDRRDAYRANNISVAWDMLDEVMHKPVSITDREDNCVKFRGDYNLGTQLITEQSVQQLTDGIACVANFEIRRIPNVYLCLMANLRRFADPNRFIQPEAQWEVARKCAQFAFREEGGRKVATAFGKLWQYWPLEAIVNAQGANLRMIYPHLAPFAHLLPQHIKHVLQILYTAPYNDSLSFMVDKTICDFPELLDTATFINNETQQCRSYASMTRPQKIVAARQILQNHPDAILAIESYNLTWQLLTQLNGTVPTHLDKMLDALPSKIYTRFISRDVIDIASRIVNAHPHLDTNRLLLLSDAVIAEFKRRAVMIYGQDKYFPLEMTEPLLDTMPCQLLTNLRPYDISTVQSDPVACRTLSRKWASCPQFLMKTQAYRDFTCQVFMQCGSTTGSIDFDHLIDDLGVYCFCNLTSSMVANLTVLQVQRLFPVLSELPNCLPQFTRIALTSRIIDIYPPKSYITELTPPGQEAWLTELGKLSCNLNAAIISERFQKTTFGSQTEYLGRVCCFNWTVSGTPEQRRLMAGVYFNKSADDMWDIRKMCDRMFNTTAYIIMNDKGEDAAAARRRRRDVTSNNVRQNCSEVFALEGICDNVDDHDDGMEEGDNVLWTKLTNSSVARAKMELESRMANYSGNPNTAPVTILRRHKRDVVIEGFTWTCPLLKAMTKDSLYLLTVDDFWMVKHLDFVRCLSFMGQSRLLSRNLSLAVLSRIKTEMSRYFSFCDTDPRILQQLGYIAQHLTTYNISCLNVTDEVVAAFGQVEIFEPEQLRAIAERYINLTLTANRTFSVVNMAMMGHVLCGLDAVLFSSSYLTDAEFEFLVPILSRLRNCSMVMLKVFYHRASTRSLFGPVSRWREEHFLELGIIVAGMGSDEVKLLTPTQMRWLPENVLRRWDFVAQFDETQLRTLLPEQVRYIWPNAATEFPLNETLNEAQRRALIIAELDDMYVTPPESQISGSTQILAFEFFIAFFFLSIFVLF